MKLPTPKAPAEAAEVAEVAEGSAALDERARLEAPARRAIAAGDRTGAATLALRLYGGEVYSFLAATATNESVADDVYGDFCEVLWNQLAAFRWQASLRSWMYAIARTLVLRHKVDGLRRQRRTQALELSPEVAALAAEVRTSTLELLRTSVKDRFRALRAELPAEERELLLLRVDRELSWRDIARILAEDAPESGTATPELDRRAALLRKRFERVKERLRTLAAERNLLPETDPS